MVKKCCKHFQTTDINIYTYIIYTYTHIYCMYICNYHTYTHINKHLYIYIIWNAIGFVVRLSEGRVTWHNFLRALAPFFYFDTENYHMFLHIFANFCFVLIHFNLTRVITSTIMETSYTRIETHFYFILVFSVLII